MLEKAPGSPTVCPCLRQRSRRSGLEGVAACECACVDVFVLDVGVCMCKGSRVLELFFPNDHSNLCLDSLHMSVSIYEYVCQHVCARIHECTHLCIYICV